MTGIRVLASPGLKARKQNPYTWLLYSQMRARVDEYSVPRAAVSSCDVLHMHWPEWELNIHKSSRWAHACLKTKLLMIDRLRSRGAKLVWTAHNLAAHDSLHPRLEVWFWPEFMKRVDGFIALSESGVTAARHRFDSLKHVPGFVVPHGHYRSEYPIDRTIDSRERLGIPGDKRLGFAVGALAFCSRYPSFYIYRNTVRANVIIYELSLIVCASAIVIALRGKGLAVHLLNSRPLRYTGMISYSMYLIHEMALKDMRKLSSSSYVVALAALAVTLGYSTLSWYGIERFCVRFGKTRKCVSEPSENLSHTAPAEA